MAPSGSNARPPPGQHAHHIAGGGPSEGAAPSTKTNNAMTRAALQQHEATYSHNPGTVSAASSVSGAPSVHQHQHQPLQPSPPPPPPPQQQQQQQQANYLQQTVTSLQAALNKKNDECSFWKNLYTNLVSHQKSSPGEMPNGPNQRQNAVGGGGDNDPKRALEEATGYFAVEMNNKRLKTERQATVMKEKLGKVLEQLSRQQQLCKEKDQRLLLADKKYEMDVAKRDHELQMCRLEKDHAVELAQLQVKVRYLESTDNQGHASAAAPSQGGGGSVLTQEARLAQVRGDLQGEIAELRRDLEDKLARLAERQDASVADLKSDHQDKISSLRLDLEARFSASAAAAAPVAASARRTQTFDCRGDVNDSKLFVAAGPAMKAGSVYGWSMKIERRNGSPRLGVVSSGCADLDCGKWLGESGVGWGYSDWGQTWHEGLHIKTDLPRFDEGDTVGFVLDLTGSGTLSASVNGVTNQTLFVDMLAKLKSGTANGDDAGVGFFPAATLLDSKVEYAEYESSRIEG